MAETCQLHHAKRSFRDLRSHTQGYPLEGPRVSRLSGSEAKHKSIRNWAVKLEAGITV